MRLLLLLGSLPGDSVGHFGRRQPDLCCSLGIGRPSPGHTCRMTPVDDNSSYHVALYPVEARLAPEQALRSANIY